MTLDYIFVFVFGIIIGSFLNVVISRYNTGIGILGRSFCPACSRKLSWAELFPVISFILQKGKCRGCVSKISFQYPVVEIITGLLFVLTYNLQSTIYNLLFYWFVVSISVVIVVYDLKHKIIPNGFVYAFILASFFNLFINSNLEIGFPGWMELFSGPVLAIPFVLLWFFSRGTWMGLGDGKLVLGIGWILGFIKGVSVLLIAFWIGAIVGIVLLFLKRKTITMKSEIPFAPFLIFGFLVVFLFNANIIEYLLYF